MNLLDQCLQSLARSSHANGGWSYAPGGTPQVEPTCLALLALSTRIENHGEPIQRGLAALRAWQVPDGSYRVQKGPEGAAWPTALALLVQAALHDTPIEPQQRAAAWLLAYTPPELKDPEEYRKNFDIDPDLHGWSWADGTFSWVEPTAWAVMALARAGFGDHPRVLEGRRMLLDRTFEAGGANCGNCRVFGRLTDPVPAVSALLLLAFVGQPTHVRLDATRRYLCEVAQTEQDLENLSWITLALSLNGADSATDELKQRVTGAHQARNDLRLFGAAPLREALAALALSVDVTNHPFRPAGQTRAFEVPASPPAFNRKLSFGQRLHSAVRGMAVKALGHLRPAPLETQVHIARVAEYNGDLPRVLREQYQSFRNKVPLKNKRVVLKPNLVEYHRDKVINTHPHVIAAAIELCRDEGAREVIVAEGPGHWRNVEYLVMASGLGDVLRSCKAPFIDLNHDSPVKTPNLGRLTKLEDLYLSETIATADVVISLPKLKTHHWAGVTLSLKNLFGTLPGICYGWPKNVLHWRGIENSIIDIALTRTPDLAIVDGIVGMDGDGPLNGNPAPTGVLVMGCDPLAVDATCCRIMQLNPAKVGHLALGEQKRLGLLQESKIQQVGESIAEVSRPFALLPHYQFLYARSRQRELQPV
jgi:uncharacterized protein (DUF362 family)